MKLFEVLKEKNLNQTVQGEAGERLKKIMEEAENMKREVEDKLTQIQGGTLLQYSVCSLFTVTTDTSTYCVLHCVSVCVTTCVCVVRSGGEDPAADQE